MFVLKSPEVIRQEKLVDPTRGGCPVVFGSANTVIGWQDLLVLLTDHTVYVTAAYIFICGRKKPYLLKTH